MELSAWKPPKGPAGLSIDGLAVAGNPLLRPDGRKYVGRALTLCGREAVVAEATPRTEMTASRYLRLLQISASIHHVCRRACGDCQRLLAGPDELTRAEKRHLYSEDPALGPVLGVGGDAAGLVLRAGGA